MAELLPVKLTVAEVVVMLPAVKSVGALQAGGAVVVNVTVTGSDIINPPKQLLTMLTVYAVPGIRPVKFTDVAEASRVWVVVAGEVVTV